MRFLLGRQATLGHAPPIALRSISAVRRPAPVMVQAINFPAAPLPTTRISYVSVSAIGVLPSASRDLDQLIDGQLWASSKSGFAWRPWLPVPQADRRLAGVIALAMRSFPGDSSSPSFRFPYERMNARRSALTLSWCVANMPCDAPG